MLIAVTGGTGFVGRYIINRLLEKGYDIRAWYRPSSDRKGFFNDGKGITWVKGILNHPPSTHELVKGVDAVVHAALERSGAGWFGGEDVVNFAQRNIIGSLRLMQEAHDNNVKRFVFISTCAVHDVILDDRRLDEAHPLWPVSHYGAHKAAIEKFVHSFGLGKEWDICSLRPTGVYGVAQPVSRSKWYDTVRKVMEGEKINSKAGGKEVHASDVAKAVEILLHAPSDSIMGQAFNCYDMYISEQMVAQAARELTNSKCEIEEVNKGPKHQIDTGKLRALGMAFGGEKLLERTVAQLVEAVRETRVSAST